MTTIAESRRDVAAVFERLVRQNAHQPDTTAAIDQFDSVWPSGVRVFCRSR